MRCPKDSQATGAATTFNTLMKMYVDRGDEQKAEQVLVRMAQDVTRRRLTR